MDSDFNWTITFSDSHWCAEVVCPQWRCYGVSSGYQNPPACLLGGVCSEGAAGRLPASLTGVFCGVVDFVCWVFPLAVWGLRCAPSGSVVDESSRVPVCLLGSWICTLWRLWHSVTLVAWCVASWGTIGCCIWLYGSCCMDSWSYISHSGLCVFWYYDCLWCLLLYCFCCLLFWFVSALSSGNLIR